jgi:hypothetical protein
MSADVAQDGALWRDLELNQSFCHDLDVGVTTSITSCNSVLSYIMDIIKKLVRPERAGWDSIEVNTREN